MAMPGQGHWSSLLCCGTKMEVRCPHSWDLCLTPRPPGIPAVFPSPSGLDRRRYVSLPAPCPWLSLPRLTAASPAAHASQSCQVSSWHALDLCIKDTIKISALELFLSMAGRVAMYSSAGTAVSSGGDRRWVPAAGRNSLAAWSGP